MRFLFLMVALFICMAIVGPDDIYAQGACPPPSSECGPWTSSADTLRFSGECFVTVTVERRMCNGVLEYRVTNINLQGYEDECSYFDEFTLRENSISTLQEWIDLRLLSDVSLYPVGVAGTVPLCSAGGMIQAKFYSASCGIWVKCSWSVTSDAPQCWEGASIPEPPEDGKISTWKWQPCGETCCRRTYKVCRENGALHVTRLGVSRITDCTDQGTYGTGNQCQDGCY